jgi:hypothetical protein
LFFLYLSVDPLSGLFGVSGDILDHRVPAFLALDSLTLFIQLSIVLREKTAHAQGKRSVINLCLLHAIIKAIMNVSDELIALRYVAVLVCMSD